MTNDEAQEKLRAAKPFWVTKGESPLGKGEIIYDEQMAPPRGGGIAPIGGTTQINTPIKEPRDTSRDTIVSRKPTDAKDAAIPSLSSEEPPPPPTGDCYVFTDCGNNFWGAWFWPTYDRDPLPPTADTITYFRHFCMRAIVVDYDIDAGTVDLVTAYKTGGDPAQNPCLAGPGDYLLGDPIDDFWFVPSAAAVAELIAAASFDTPPPGTGIIRLTIFMEMHREFTNSWVESTAGGGKFFNEGFAPGNLVGDETTSIPAVMKVCWTTDFS